MRSLTMPTLGLITAMAASALLAPAADAACSKAKRRPARGADAAAPQLAKKCKKKTVVLRRGYRGKTSQGEPISLETTKRGAWVTLHFYAKQRCTSRFGNPPTTASEEFNTVGPHRVRNTRFTGVIPAFDALVPVKATVTGRAGTKSASGRVSVAAGSDGDSYCDASSFTFNVPKVRETRGTYRF